MVYEWIPSPNFASGRTQTIRYIVIHHWDDPAKQPKIEGVINHFKDPSIEVAAHYVVSGDRIAQMVKESDTAWHARSANPFTIGIEVDPNVPGNTYVTVGRLVNEIRQRHGLLPLRRHSDFVQTDCPGNLDLARIDKEANTQGEDMTPQKGVTPTATEVTYVFVNAFKRVARQDELDTYTTHSWADLVHAAFESNEFKTRLKGAVTPDSELQTKAAKYDQIKQIALS